MKKTLFRIWSCFVLLFFLVLFWLPFILGLFKIPWRYIRYEYDHYLAAIKVVYRAFVEGKKQK